MKKILVSLLALALALALTSLTALAEGDYAQMTDEALHALIDGARNELAKRELAAAENTVLFEREGVTLFLTGEHEVWGDETVYLTLGVTVVNDSGRRVAVTVNSASVNGWNVFGMGASATDAGKKQRATLEFDLSAAGITTFEEIEDIELSLSLYDDDAWETIAEIEPVTVRFGA